MKSYIFRVELSQEADGRWNAVVPSLPASYTLGNTQGNGFETVSALVDTGASYSWVPKDVLERLGVPVQARWEFELANGQ